jgi:peroxiredoxin
VFTAALLLSWLILGLVCWIIFELVRQNGRLLLRLEALEQQLGLSNPAASAGLPVGSVVHDFELPDLKGGREVFSQWRGRRLLLIFFDPRCQFSRAMLPDLAALPVEAARRTMPVIVSTGAADENAQLLGPYEIQWPVLLQRDHEVASLFGVDGTPMGYAIDEDGRTASRLAVGAEALLALAGAPPSTPLTPHSGPNPATARPAGLVNMVTRTEVQSRINRSGLTAGTPAPDFCLPGLDGGELSLQDYRGRRVLLVFSDPNCGPCDALAPDLELIHRRASDPQVAMITRGSLEVNRAKVAEHDLTFPIGLQRRWEISRAYGMFATPIGYMIDEQGVVAAPVAVGGDAIVRLASEKPRKTILAAKEVLLGR